MVNSKKQNQRRDDEETVRELMDSAMDVLREGMADHYVVDFWNVITERAEILENRGGKGTSSATKKVANSGSKNSGTKSSTSKSSTAKSSTTKSSTAKSSTAKSSSGSRSKGASGSKGKSTKEQLYGVPGVSRFEGVEVRIVGKSKKDSSKSNIEVVTSDSETYPVGKKLAIKTERLAKV